MGSTGTRATSTPQAVPDVLETGRATTRVRPAGRPPTLGDKLQEALRVRNQATDQAAHAMGVPTADLLAWTADAALPDRKHESALMAYLEVDERTLRALVLRGQMRRAQARIRN